MVIQGLRDMYILMANKNTLGAKSGMAKKNIN